MYVSNNVLDNSKIIHVLYLQQLDFSRLELSRRNRIESRIPLSILALSTLSTK